MGAGATGRGLHGLRRALVLAGAQAQLVFLWKAADAQPQTLMVVYYQRLLKCEGARRHWR
jgi:CHAT domain-containing protein